MEVFLWALRRLRGQEQVWFSGLGGWVLPLNLQSWTVREMWHQRPTLLYHYHCSQKLLMASAKKKKVWKWPNITEMCLTEVVHFMDSCSFSGTWITLTNSFFLSLFSPLIFFCLQFSDVFSDSGGALRSLSSHRLVPASLPVLLSFSWEWKQDKKPTRVEAGFSERLWWRHHWWRRNKVARPWHAD